MKGKVIIILVFFWLLMEAVPVLSQQAGTCTLVINAADELSRSVSVYLNENQVGTLKDGVLVITKLLPGTYKVRLRGSAVQDSEFVVEFKQDFEVRSLLYQAKPVSQLNISNISPFTDNFVFSSTKLRRVSGDVNRSVWVDEANVKYYMGKFGDYIYVHIEDHETKPTFTSVAWGRYSKDLIAVYFVDVVRGSRKKAGVIIFQTINESNMNAYFLTADVKQSQGALTGVWDCDDDGVYYITQYGNKIFWYAERPDLAFALIGVGEIESDNKHISLTAVDLPKGAHGARIGLRLRIESDGSLTKIWSESLYWGNVWKKRK